MNKNVIILFSVCFFSNFCKAIFQQPMKEELQEIVLHQQQNFMKEQTLQEVEDYILKNSSLKTMENIEPLNNLQQRLFHDTSDANNQMVAQQLLDVCTTFKKLKELMNIPNEVDIIFAPLNAHNPDGAAVYNSIDRTIYVGLFFLGQPPSKKLFTLIHELTHCQQHMRMKGLPYMLANTIALEQEAEAAAAQAIQCPICMQIIQDACPKNSEQQTQQGYLTKEELGVLKNLKTDSNQCQAHATHSIDNQKLKKILPLAPATGLLNAIWTSGSRLAYWWKQNKLEIDRQNLDFQIGSMQERLSTVQFKKIASS